MRTPLLLATLALIASTGFPQTTGVVGVNDLTLNGVIGSGTTSGMSANDVTFCTPSTLTFAVSTAPGATVLLFASAAPVVPGSLFLGTCPGSALGSTIDLPLSPLPIQFAGGVADGSGVFSTIAIPLPLLFQVTLSVQGVIVGGSCSPLLQATQAFNLNLSSGPLDCPE